MGVFARVGEEIVMQWVIRDSLHFVRVGQDSNRIRV